VNLLDAHLHFFSWDFFQTLARMTTERSGQRPEDLLKKAAAQAGFELPPRDPVEHLQRWLSELDRHGVDKAAAFASIPQEAEAVRVAASDADERLIPYVCADPTAPGAAGFGRRAFREMGFRGLLLFPSLHHYDLCGEACHAVLEEAAAARAVVVVHCGILEIKVRDLLGLPRVYDLRYSNPLSVVPVANRFPKVAFIIPHFGAGLFRETLIAGAQCPNIHVDTSSSNGWTRTQPEAIDLEGVFRRTLSVFGPERILFGTDSTTFPRGWRSDIYRAQSALVEKIGLSIGERNLVFGQNLMRILELKP
jgi:predicted TIM-barrel fold metal-dependent hydrolase